MKYIRIFARILLGVVFIFSGFVKGIDPMGSAIKFSEYFGAFHMDWFKHIALILSFLLSNCELLIGICLLIGLRMKISAWGALLFISFFTVLTFISALVNPVSDCGCFGDALILTNWQTFYKNIFLILLAILIFYNRNQYKPLSNAFAEWGLVLFFALIGTGLSVYCYRNLPIMDFRPFHIGTHIPSGMIIPKNAPSDTYKTQLYYQKNGITKEFTPQNYPWKDSTWKWVKTTSTLLKKGYTPPIHGFSITPEGKEEITSRVLSDTSYSFIFISFDLQDIQPNAWNTINNYYYFAQNNSHQFYFLTSATSTDASIAKSNLKLPYDFLFSDETALKTIMRSNPGLMLLKDGVVMGLWSDRDFPDTSYFRGNILSKIVTGYNHEIEWGKIILLGVGFLLIIFVLIDFRWRNN
jgi:uncharacterized membrane protein YphA (DoxX/SURF4 family)